MNKGKLEDEMKKRGITKGEMCTMLGMSRSAFYRKCNEITQFTQKEIEQIVELLKLDSPLGIFFDKKVS